MDVRQIQLRADSALIWSTVNPTLLDAEVGVETDTGRFKIGDGSSAWNDLGYARVDLSVSRDATTVTVAASGDDATLPAATADDAGVMSAADKAKLDTITASADVISDVANLLTGANIFRHVDGQTFVADNISNDGVIVVGRAGGGSSYRVTLKPGTLSGNRTLTAPDTTGTIVTTGDAGTVTSAMIANGAIVNDDINAAAAIVDTKLATIATAGKVSNSATTATDANTASAIVARDGSGNFSAGTITAALSGNASTSTKLSSSRSFALTGDVTGSVSSDLTSGASIATSIAAGVVVNADVNASAAIAGTKISPDFGAQAVVTTGTITGASLIPSSATVPANGLYLPAANSVALSTGTSERARIDSSGRLLVGTSSGFTSVDQVPNIFLATTNNLVGTIGVGQFASTNFGAGLDLIRSDSGVVGQASGGAIPNNGQIGALRFNGSDGTTFRIGARIGAFADGTWASGDCPTRLVFSTTANGASSPTERMRIDSAGFISIGGDTNTGLSNPSADNLAITTGGSERARIDSSGRLLVGTSTSVSQFGVQPQIQATGTTGSGGHLGLTVFNSAANSAPALVLGHSKGTTVGSYTASVSGDLMGSVAFSAGNGTDMRQGASIAGFADGSWGVNDHPGRLIFSTTASGGSSPTERMRITSAGVLQIADAGNITVGTTTGTKIGTATTQKLGFYNATPVVQPAAVADATDAASVITQLNALLSRLRTLGIIAT